MSKRAKRQDRFEASCRTLDELGFMRCLPAGDNNPVLYKTETDVLIMMDPDGSLSLVKRTGGGLEFIEPEEVPRSIREAILTQRIDNVVYQIMPRFMVYYLAGDAHDIRVSLRAWLPSQVADRIVVRGEGCRKTCGVTVKYNGN